MESSPKISIIMSIYNCQDTLAEAIDSILEQTFTDWYLIMCDDASTDDTYKIAKNYVDKYPDKMLLFSNEKNMKLSYSLNRCLERVKTEFVARMDGDDISKPERLQKEYDFLCEHKDADLVSCLMERFDENGVIDIAPTPYCPDYYSLRYEPQFFHATILTYKKVYDDLGGYREDDWVERGEDYDLWFRFFAKGFKGYNIQEPLYLVRENSNALGRRDFRNRWNGMKIRKNGYKLLNYPKRWLVIPFCGTIFKSIAPNFLVSPYRKIRKKLYS
ncbi:MAG: glycosyltransferase [Enterococcus sp.]|nr:glycosyltransferase [Enterococcus sp.]